MKAALAVEQHIGKVARLALTVGTELVFSPVYHPQSNGSVERFHQDYNRHVWENIYLSDLTAVNKQALSFFELYRQRQGHSQLKEQTPATVHLQQQPHKLDVGFQLADEKQPLREGRLHFMRRVSSEGTVRVLNVDWSLPRFDCTKSVWVTIDFKVTGATLSIFDAAPDAPTRQCLATYPFPLGESILPREKERSACDMVVEEQEVDAQEGHLPVETFASEPNASHQLTISIAEWFVLSAITRTVRLANRLIFTMY